MLAPYPRKTRRVSFTGGTGHRLVGILDYPDGEPRGTALYAPCFTCGKDLKATARIGRALAEWGIAVLRFDFTGIGDSHGSFAETNFSDNQSDVVAAADFLRKEMGGPELLIGHSLGGAAVLSVAGEIKTARGIVALATPSDTVHLANHLVKRDPRVLTEGQGSVHIGGRPFEIRPHLIEDLKSHVIEDAVRHLQLPLLVMHSPADEILAYYHAERLFAWAAGPKSLVTLDQADHLLISHPRDIPFVSTLIACWAIRYAFTPRAGDEEA